MGIVKISGSTAGFNANSSLGTSGFNPGNQSSIPLINVNTNIPSTASSIYSHYDPTSLKIETEYNYDPDDGGPFSLPSFKKYSPPKLSFEMKFDDYTFDKTVQNKPTASSIAALKAMAHVGSNFAIRKVPIVDVIFGTFAFRGVITKIEVEVTAIDAKMTPKRANVSLEILRYYSSNDEIYKPDSL